MAVRCAILDDYQNVVLKVADWSKVKGDVEFKVFNEHLGGPDKVIAALKGFQIVVAMRERTGFPKQVIEALPDLKLLITTGMRNASIDTEAAKARGVTVCGTGSFGSPTSGIAIGLMLELTRHIGYENARLHAGAAWQTTIGPDLEGMTLGVLGLGKLGTRTANIAKAFGMKVIAWSQNLTPEKCQEAGVGYVSKDELFRQSDFITIHVVLSPRIARPRRRPRARPDEANGLPRSIPRAARSSMRRRCLPRCATRRSPAPGLMSSTSSRCRSIIRCARWTTSSSRRISATSPSRTTGRYFAGVVEDIRGFLDGKPVRVMS